MIPLRAITWEGKRPACTCREGPKCSSIGKHPANRYGTRAPTTEIDRVDRVWAADTQLGVAVVTGEVSQLAILDIDPRNGGDASWKRLLRRLPQKALRETFRVRTGGGGSHLYFRTQDEWKCRTGFWPGLDFKSRRGFAVIHGVHASGNRYRISRDGKVWPLPRALADLVRTSESERSDYTAKPFTGELPRFVLRKMSMDDHLRHRMEGIRWDGDRPDDTVIDDSESAIDYSVAVMLSKYHAEGWEIEHALRWRRAQMGSPKRDSYYQSTVSSALALSPGGVRGEGLDLTHFMEEE